MNDYDISEEFIKYYRNRNHLKNVKEAKEKVELFWDTILKSLDEDEKVVLKNWGTFEKKEVKARRVMIPKMDKIIIIDAKEKIRFKAGKGLRNVINGADVDE